MVFKDYSMLKVLLDLAPTVVWLEELGAINFSKVPEAHIVPLKKLEALGIVYRRNARTCELQRQRLVKILNRETQNASPSLREACSFAFGSLLTRNMSLEHEANTLKHAGITS